MYKENDLKRLVVLWVLKHAIANVKAVGLVTTFYCLRFQTSLFIASYDSRGYGGGIRPRLHTGDRLTVLYAEEFVRRLVSWADYGYIYLVLFE
jgi:hypothetical protein